jgi:hypothetical protein
VVGRLTERPRPVTILPRRRAAMMKVPFLDHDLVELAAEVNLTRVGSNKLWQIGLLEMWLQQHGVSG